MTQLTYTDLHRAIHRAQLNQWDDLDAADEPVAFRTDLNTRELLAWIARTDPTEGFTTCQRCREAIVEWGNVVYVRADGSLDPALFPTLDVEADHHHPWLPWYQQLTILLTQHKTGVVRPVNNILLRGTDGATYPKSLRGEPHTHLCVKYTPRRPASTRTLIKRNARIQDRSNVMAGMMMLTAPLVEAVLALHTVRMLFSETCITRLITLHAVLCHVDQAEHMRVRKNILMAASAQSPAFLSIPEDWLWAIERFAVTQDLHDLRPLGGMMIPSGENDDKHQTQ